MNHCVKCGLDFDNKNGTYRANVCDPCLTPKILGFPYFRETIANKYEGNLSKSWVKELERSRICPIEKNDGGYFVGRKGDNGKVQEKEAELTLD